MHPLGPTVTLAGRPGPGTKGLWEQKDMCRVTPVDV